MVVSVKKDDAEKLVLDKKAKYIEWYVKTSF
jgi:hypothetical protein